MAGFDGAAQTKAVLEAMRALTRLDHDAPPAVIATRAIRAAQDLYCDGDPFAEIKARTTVEALELYGAVKGDVVSKLSTMEPVDRIRYCAKLAAAGNIIDFGVSSEFDLERTLKETLAGDLAIDHSELLYQAIASGDSMLLISDNAGEIVFDRFLLDEVVGSGKDVYVSVKSGGILNDAVREDAIQAGIKEPIRIVETGSDGLGIVLEDCSDEFRDIFFRAGVVVSKGQANYETLDDAPRSLFFILRAKCPIIAESMAIPAGASVLNHHPGSGLAF